MMPGLPNVTTVCGTSSGMKARCGGLGCAADDHREKALPPQPLGGLFGVVQRHGIDDGVALLNVVDRKLVELVLQQRRGQLR